VVTEDIENFRFNTMLARLMEYTHFLGRIRDSGNVAREDWEQALESLVLMMAPAAPHIAEELWERLGRPYSVHQQAWPAWDEDAAQSRTFTLVVQVNGKLRDRFDVAIDIPEREAIELAMTSAKVISHVEGHNVQKVLFVPNRLVNIVVN
jgi:leucyl-tRNA synthetase